jgi:hypothetical protein
MTPVEEVLQTWREAERVLAALPSIDPDHESVELAIFHLKASYRQLTDVSGRWSDVIASSRLTVADTHALLDRVRGTDLPAGPSTHGSGGG